MTDHSKGFGGKYGVQEDRVDKSAVGWDHKENVEKHESQKGLNSFRISSRYGQTGSFNWIVGFAFPLSINKPHIIDIGF